MISSSSAAEANALTFSNPTERNKLLSDPQEGIIIDHKNVILRSCKHPIQMNTLKW